MTTDPLSRRRFLQFTGSAGIALGLSGAGHAAPLRPNVLPQSGALLDGLVASGRIPGGLAALGVAQGPLATRAAGGLVRGGVRAPDADSLWRLYSMTKPITGIATMQLIEDGRLALDQPLYDILPEWAAPRVQLNADTLDSRPARTPITIRHLLTHTAGLGYAIVTKGPLLAEYLRLRPQSGAGQPAGDPRHSQRAQRAFAGGVLQPAGHPAADRGAGARAGAIRSPFDLLGRVIEVASGRPFDLFLDERLFGPLGMADTSFVVPRDKLDRLTTSYGSLGGIMIPIDPAANSVFSDKPSLPLWRCGTGRIGGRLRSLLENASQ